MVWVPLLRVPGIFVEGIRRVEFDDIWSNSLATSHDRWDPPNGVLVGEFP